MQRRLRKNRAEELVSQALDLEALKTGFGFNDLEQLELAFIVVYRQCW